MPKSELIVPEPSRARAVEVNLPVSGSVVEPISESTVLLQVISRAAADKSLDLDRVERLMLMHEKITAKRAEMAFIEAMAKFKETAPKIFKNKRTDFEHRDGQGSTSYKYATLGAICEAAIMGLASVGISHRWDLAQGDQKVTVTCVLTHTGGHSTQTTLSAGADASGKKNPIQQVASTITYLQKYTLLGATGLATEEQDDDGHASTATLEDAPEGYEKWRADMDALEFTPELLKAWKGTNEIYRTYAATFDRPWWSERKAKCESNSKQQGNQQ
jgi:ERF superfamily